VHPSGAPLLYFGARGTIGLELTLYGANRALHDGHYGNWAPNPAAMAATLLASMRSPDGMIRIPGFEAGTRPLTSLERQALDALLSVDRVLQQSLGLAQPESAESLARSLMRPALNVRALRAGEIGPAAANAIPAEAQISLDFRLVPDQTTAGVREAVEHFLQVQGWTLLSAPPDAAVRLAHARLMQVQWGVGYPALRTDLSSPPAQAVARAARDAARGPVALMPMMGGSVPIYLIDSIFRASVVGLPIVNYDDNQHAADENLRLQNLWDGITTYAAMMAMLHW
jgi:acetylornithine deacetylase/succinyl-diaminopimelate desuccinylase-like protein